VWCSRGWLANVQLGCEEEEEEEEEEEAEE